MSTPTPAAPATTAAAGSPVETPRGKTVIADRVAISEVPGRSGGT